MECVSCGSVLPEGSTFCNTCGAPQTPPRAAASSAPDVTDTRLAQEPAGAEASAEGKAPKKRRVVLAVVLGLALVAAGGAIAWKVSSDRAAAALAASEREAVKQAAAEASKVMTAVEKCEGAVKVGVTLDDLSTLATSAEQAVEAFKRTDASKRMPTFTSAVAAAATYYTDSCAAWFEANKTATKKYDAAVHKWIYHNAKEPQLEDFQDDSEYQAAWSMAGISMDEARAAFDVESIPTPAQ
jgi:hypothetical protein